MNTLKKLAIGAALETINFYSKILLYSQKPLTVRPEKVSNCETHMVVRHIDILIGINSAKTFYKHSGLNIPLFIHLDEDVTSLDIFLLKKHLPFATIIKKSEASRMLTKKIKKYDYCKKLRIGWQGIKLIDMPLLSRTKKIIILDSDLFFFNKINDIRSWVLENQEYNLFFNDYKHFSELSFTEFEGYLGFKRLNNKFNTGILCLNLKYYNLDFIEKVLKTIQKTLYERIRYDDDRWEIEYRHLVEQTSYLALYSVSPSKPLGKKYVIYPIIKNLFNKIDFSNFKCIHFTGEFPRYRIYHAILKFYQPKIYNFIKYLNRNLLFFNKYT